MSDLSVKHLTEQEVAELRDQYPDDDIKEFQLVDDGEVVDYFETEQEARDVLDDLTKRSLVEDAFREWAQKTAEEVGMPREEVVEIVKECY